MHRQSGLGEIDGLHNTMYLNAMWRTCVLINGLEGLSLSRISGLSDRPYILGLSC